jgi:uncharacterized damage-inducible protein DinB
MVSVRRLSEEAKGQSLEVMEKFYRETSVKFKALLDELDMDVHMEYTHPHHGTLKATYADIMQHAVNHGTYHRGNIAAMLRQIGFCGYEYRLCFFICTK